MIIKPSPKLYLLWFVHSLITLALVMSPVFIILIIGAFTVLNAEATAFLSVYLQIVLPGVILPIYLFVWFWLKHYIKSLKYELTKDEIIVSGGVWWKVVKNIPYHKITNIKQMQGPLERVWSLGSIALQTAGQGQTSAPEGKLNGLKDFEKVKNEILKHVKKFKK
jgi:membrane protein YdbS with pleckstrin-like domain